jgi:hypothetical protein
MIEGVDASSLMMVLCDLGHILILHVIIQYNCLKKGIVCFVGRVL